MLQQLEHGQGKEKDGKGKWKGKDGEPQDEGVAEKRLGTMTKGTLLLLWGQTLCALKKQI